VVGVNHAKEATDSLAKSLKDGAYEEAVETLDKLIRTVDYVREGKVKAKDALILYNETLGKTLGAVNSWEQAEDNIMKKGALWLKYIQLKTESQAMFAEAADASAQLVAKDFEGNTFAQKTKAALIAASSLTEWSEKERMKVYDEVLVEELRKDKVHLENKKKIYTDAGKKIEEEMLKIAETLGVIDPIGDGKDPKTKPQKKQKELDRIEELKKQYENELKVADTAYKKGELGYMQHQWRIVEITEEFARKRLNAIQNLSKKESDSRVQLENDMISNLTKATTDIGETGVQAIHKLAKERGKDFADEYIKGLKESIKNNLTAEGQAAAVNWFNTMVAGAKPPNLSNIGEGEKQTSYDRNKLLEEYIMYLGAAQQILGALNDLSSTLLDRDMAALDLKIEKQQEAFDLEEEHIKQMGLSKEEEAKRLAKLEAQKGAQEKLNAQERKKIQQQEAIRNKAFSVMNIGLQTTQAIMQFLVNPGGPLGVKLSIAAGVTGGIQLAAALATPIPQFAKGTDNAPEGYAIVGEKGTELVTEPSGKQWLTPAKDTLTYLKKGSKVTTNEDLMDMVKNQAFATLATMNKPITTDLYGKQLIEQFEALTSKVDRLSDVMANKNMSTQIIGNFDHYMHVKKNIR
jgi:hypothetical protein